MFCSVAMSTYNGERFLAEQLSSICAQTRPVDEIVVSDDGSSDGTLRILDDFRLAHPQIHWKILPSAENHGFRESFLRALKACGGDLIFLCDQDDRWAPGKVETMLRHFEANPAMLSLISDFKTIDADGNLLHEGTAAELVEKGLFKNTQTVTNVFYAGHCRPQGVYSLTRKRIRRGVLCNAPGARSSVPKKSRPPITGIEKPDELQRAVHELCLYNAAARKAGKKELSYGYWAAAGKPEAPA